MRPQFTVEPGFLIAGPIIWAAHFLFINTINALLCARPSSGLSNVALGLPVSSWIILMASVLALGVMAWVTIRQRQRSGPGGRAAFSAALTRSLCLLSALAVIWQTMPVFLVSECG